jgi:hypothetical protein
LRPGPQVLSQCLEEARSSSSCSADPFVHAFRLLWVSDRRVPLGGGGLNVGKCGGAIPTLGSAHAELIKALDQIVLSYEDDASSPQSQLLLLQPGSQEATAYANCFSGKTNSGPHVVI